MISDCQRVSDSLRHLVYGISIRHDVHLLLTRPACHDMMRSHLDDLRHCCLVLFDEHHTGDLHLIADASSAAVDRSPDDHLDATQLGVIRRLASIRYDQRLELIMSIATRRVELANQPRTAVDAPEEGGVRGTN